MFDFMIHGGIQGMIVITAFGLAALVMAVYGIAKLIHKKPLIAKHHNAILYLGSLAFLGGLLWTAIGLYEVLDVVQRLSPVKQSALAAGLKAAYIGTLWGAFLFFISYVFWFVLRFFQKS